MPTCSCQSDNQAQAAVLYSQNQLWKNIEGKKKNKTGKNKNKIKISATKSKQRNREKPWGRLKTVLNWYLCSGQVERQGS